LELIGSEEGETRDKLVSQLVAHWIVNDNISQFEKYKDTVSSSDIKPYLPTYLNLVEGFSYLITSANQPLLADYIRGSVQEILDIGNYSTFQKTFVADGTYEKFKSITNDLSNYILCFEDEFSKQVLNLGVDDISQDFVIEITTSTKKNASVNGRASTVTANQSQKTAIETKQTTAKPKNQIILIRINLA